MGLQHYPKTKKYISLFPPEARHASSSSDPTTSAPGPESDKSNREREEIRSWVKECMDKGELPTEPELHLDSAHNPKTSQKFSTSTKAASSKADKSTSKGAPDIAEDDFFGNEDSSEDSD